MVRRCVLVLAIVSTILTGLLSPDTAFAQAKGTPGQIAVDLELVLAVDVSYSMDIEEQRLQRDGYVQAFRNEEILKAIKSGQHGRIAVAYIEWAGIGTQAVLLPWTLIDGAASAETFAIALSGKPLRHDRRTSISGALEYSRDYFQQSPFRGVRRVIDVSGDGPNNSGRPVTEVREEVLRQGIVINGLPIILRPSTRGSRFDIQDLDAYYARCVIGGPGSFMVPIRTRPEFATATRQKLLLEIAAAPLADHIIKTQFTLDNRPEADCMVGEKRRRGFDYWGDSPP